MSQFLYYNMYYLQTSYIVVIFGILCAGQLWWDTSVIISQLRYITVYTTTYQIYI